jgi:hypothetical protein
MQARRGRLDALGALGGLLRFGRLASCCTRADLAFVFVVFVFTCGLQ